MRLYFLNPVFNRGTNLTCRKGIKWANATGEVPIFRTGTEDLYGYAKILDTQIIPFQFLEDEDLHLEHDPSCHTVNGLYDAMRQAYPNFDSRELVTLVYFDFKPAEVTA